MSHALNVKAAELHEATAKSHRVAADLLSKAEHGSAKAHASKALMQSTDAHEASVKAQSTDAPATAKSM